MGKHEFWWMVYTAALEGVYAAGVPAGEEVAADTAAAKAADVAMIRLGTQHLDTAEHPASFFHGKAF
jgi:hypothetical protein